MAVVDKSWWPINLATRSSDSPRSTKDLPKEWRQDGSGAQLLVATSGEQIWTAVRWPYFQPCRDGLASISVERDFPIFVALPPPNNDLPAPFPEGYVFQAQLTQF